jgi:putative ABC transport system permease protein
MRAIRKLSPTQDDDFALNDMWTYLNQSARHLRAWRWVGYSGSSLIVGMFGVANNVRNRTWANGADRLKKQSGSKKVILTEFLLESAFLCIIGGMIGLLLVFILTNSSNALAFPFLFHNNMILQSVSAPVGVLAGFIRKTGVQDGPGSSFEVNRVVSVIQVILLLY